MSRRVLVRDRNILRTVVKIYLGSEFEVVGVTTDEEARAHLLAGDVDVVVADLDEAPASVDLVRGAWLLEHEPVARRTPALFMSSDPKAGPVVSSDLIVLEKPVYRDVFLDAFRRLTAVRAS
jgi:hypothetical protein